MQLGSIYLTQALIGGLQCVPCFLSINFCYYSSEYAFMHGLVYVEQIFSIFLPLFPQDIFLSLCEIVICRLIYWFCITMLDYLLDILTFEQSLHCQRSILIILSCEDWSLQTRHVCTRSGSHIFNFPQRFFLRQGFFPKPALIPDLRE